MTSRGGAILVLLSLVATPAHGQYRAPRSMDYLLRATAWGARALWVDPGGLGTVHEASLMAEVVLERVVGLMVSREAVLCTE